MPNLRGVSTVGRDRGGCSNAARTDGSHRPLQGRRDRGKPRSGEERVQLAEDAGWVH